MSNIPLSVPSLNGNELEYIKECLDTEWVSSAGKYVDIFENKIAEYTGANFAVACTNGTSALHVSLRLAGVGPGDLVIVPTITFIAPVNAITYLGATPVFMDADQHYNIDAEKTIEFIKNETVFTKGFTYNKKSKKRIQAILPVHVWGNACWLEELDILCHERNIAIVEDASESLGTIYTRGEFASKHTGTVGKLGCLSFNGNKIITAGGGGMILTDDSNFAVKARYFTTQSKDDPVRYIHNEIGYNFRLTNIQAAMGVAQLEQLPEFLKRKKEINEKYKIGIEDIDGLKLVKTPEYSDNNNWLNILQIDKKIFGQSHEALMARFEKKGIQTRPIWHLNHKQKPYENCQTYKIENASNLLGNSLCLPSSSNLSDEDIMKVIHQFHPR
jgi:perosamine synthetase